MNYLILVNKNNGLNKEYIPNNLVKVSTKTGGNKTIYLEKKTYHQIKKLLKEMNQHFSSTTVIDSGYRPYLYQENLLNDLINIKGEEAYQSIAKPGFSEHQTGLAVDIGFYQNSYYDEFFEVQNYVAEFQWLEENAFKYGFIIRYPKNKEDITGYIYEPWHLRYVGDLAFFLQKYNLTLEEYYEFFI